jgi:hypothetical protein
VVDKLAKLVQNPGNDQGVLFRQVFFDFRGVDFSQSDGKHFGKDESSFDVQHEAKHLLLNSINSSFVKYGISKKLFLLQ